MAGEYHAAVSESNQRVCAQRKEQARVVFRKRNQVFHIHALQTLLRDEVAEQVMEQQAIVPVKIAPPASDTCIPDRSYRQEIQIRKGELSISLPDSVSAAYILEIIKGIS